MGDKKVHAIIISVGAIAFILPLTFAVITVGWWIRLLATHPLDGLLEKVVLILAHFGLIGKSSAAEGFIIILSLAVLLSIVVVAWYCIWYSLFAVSIVIQAALLKHFLNGKDLELIFRGYEKGFYLWKDRPIPIIGRLLERNLLRIVSSPPTSSPPHDQDSTPTEEPERQQQ